MDRANNPQKLIIKKILYLILIVIFLMGFYGNQPKASAADQTEKNPVSFRVYRTRLERELNSKTKNSKLVPQFMSWIRDPDGDGDPSDNFLNEPNWYLRSLHYDAEAVKGRFPNIIRDIVLNWEATNHYEIKFLTEEDVEKAAQMEGTLIQKFASACVNSPGHLAAFFAEFRPIAGRGIDWVTGDAKIRRLAFVDTGTYSQPDTAPPYEPVYPLLELREKWEIRRNGVSFTNDKGAKITGRTAIDMIYDTQRMRHFRDDEKTKDFAEWTTDERDALREAVEEQSAVLSVLSNFSSWFTALNGRGINDARILFNLFNGFQVVLDAAGVRVGSLSKMAIKKGVVRLPVKTANLYISAAAGERVYMNVFGNLIQYVAGGLPRLINAMDITLIDESERGLFQVGLYNQFLALVAPDGKLIPPPQPSANASKAIKEAWQQDKKTTDWYNSRFPQTMQTSKTLKSFCSLNNGHFCDYDLVGENISLFPNLLRERGVSNVLVKDIAGNIGLLLDDSLFKGYIVRLRSNKTEAAIYQGLLRWLEYRVREEFRAGDGETDFRPLAEMVIDYGANYITNHGAEVPLDYIYKQEGYAPMGNRPALRDMSLADEFQNELSRMMNRIWELAYAKSEYKGTLEPLDQRVRILFNKNQTYEAYFDQLSGTPGFGTALGQRIANIRNLYLQARRAKLAGKIADSERFYKEYHRAVTDTRQWINVNVKPTVRL